MASFISRAAGSIAAIFRSAGSAIGTTLQRLSPFGLPPIRGTRERLQAYRRQPWWRAITHRIKSAVEGAEWHVYRKGVDRKKKGAELPNHPLAQLLKTANPVMPGSMAIGLTQLHLDATGEAFWLLMRNAYGEPIEAYPIPPHWVRQTPGAKSPFFQISHGELQVNLPAADVIWFKELDPENPYGRGAGFGEALSDDLAADEYAAKRVQMFFWNQGLPDAIVSVKGAGPDEIKRAEAKFAEYFRGVFKSGRTHFTSGDVQISRIDTTFKDTQLVQLRQQERDTVRQVFGVPPEILGILDQSNRSTIDAAEHLFLKLTVTPRLKLLKIYLNAFLVPQYSDGANIEVDFDSVIPADQDFILQVMQARPGAFTDNEVREFVGFPKAEGKDTFPEPTAFPSAQLTAPEPARRFLRGRTEERHRR